MASLIWAASSEFGTYRLCEQQRFRRACAVSPEPPLLAHTSSESGGTFRQKARSLAPLNGWACAVKICHDGMLEDTNSLEAPHIMMFNVLSFHLCNCEKICFDVTYVQGTLQGYCHGKFASLHHSEQGVCCFLFWWYMVEVRGLWYIDKKPSWLTSNFASIWHQRYKFTYSNTELNINTLWSGKTFWKYWACLSKTGIMTFLINPREIIQITELIMYFFQFQCENWRTLSSDLFKMIDFITN